MTADELKKMQEDSFRRHLDKSFDFYDGRLMPKKKYKKREKKLMPDLMAAQIPVSFTSEKKEENSITKKQQPMSQLNLDKPYVPKPVQEKKRPYVHFTALPPDPPKRKKERPPAIYSNSASPYGIYDELKQEADKKTG